MKLIPPPPCSVQAAVFLRSCFLNFAVTAERFIAISVNRVTTHTGLPKSWLPDSSASEAELLCRWAGFGASQWLTGMCMT